MTKAIELNEGTQQVDMENRVNARAFQLPRQFQLIADIANLLSDAKWTAPSVLQFDGVGGGQTKIGGGEPNTVAYIVSNIAPSAISVLLLSLLCC
jgi:hypothetical protein